MEDFWNLVKFVVFAAIAMTIITNVIQYRRAKRENPNRSFWDNMDVATQRINDMGLSMSKNSVKSRLQDWAEEDEALIEARKEQAEAQLAMEGYRCRGALNDTTDLYEKDGVTYEYDAVNNELREY